MNAKLAIGGSYAIFCTALVGTNILVAKTMKKVTQTKGEKYGRTPLQLDFNPLMGIPTAVV